LSRPGRDILPVGPGSAAHASARRLRDIERKRRRPEDIMIKNHPLRILGTGAALTAVLFLLSASGNSSWWSHGPGWLGAFGWAGFLVGLLGLVLLAAYLGVTKLRQPHIAKEDVPGGDLGRQRADGTSGGV
jgi:hypothetical protein